MADIDDVMAAIAAIVADAIYPNGTSNPSAIAVPVQVMTGWPKRDALIAFMRSGGVAGARGGVMISVYPMPSTTSKLPVPLASGNDGVIVAPVHGMTATVTDTGFTLLGDPFPGEYATVLLNRKAYSQAAAEGDVADGVAAALLAQIFPDWPLASRSGSALTIPGPSSIVVRIGAGGRCGTVIDRQRQNIMVSVWAPNHGLRTATGRVVDVVIKRNLTVPMPDTTQAILRTQTTNLNDGSQEEDIYRRDLIIQAQWDTLDTFDAYEVTSVDVRLPDERGRTFAY